jgi:hypothetical protein
MSTLTSLRIVLDDGLATRRNAFADSKSPVEQNKAQEAFERLVDWRIFGTREFAGMRGLSDETERAIVACRLRLNNRSMLTRNQAEYDAVHVDYRAELAEIVLAELSGSAAPSSAPLGNTASDAEWAPRTEVVSVEPGDDREITPDGLSPQHRYERRLSSAWKGEK